MRTTFETSAKSLLTLVAVLSFASHAAAASGDDVLGLWNNQEKDARIELFRCGEKYCGKIVELKEPNYPAGSQEGIPGTPKVDHHNPESARRTQPILGLRIVNDFIYAGENKWKDGTVYDPKNGKTYRGSMTLVAPGKLDLRGFVGIPLFGRTTTWTK